MSEGKWVEAKHEDIREGDVVRVTTKEGPKTTVVEGKVTKVAPRWNGEYLWSIENFENFYPNEFEPDDDGEFSTLERFVPAFEWPTKLGAIVQGRDGDDTVYAVLVEVAETEDNIPLFWTKEWGSVNMYDIEGLEDLTVVSEGVTVEA